jgi:tetratricopeptide (TPR) repeat protein
MRASIYQAQGLHNKAMKDCTALLGHASMLVTSTCIAESRSMQGALLSSYNLLNQAHQNTLNETPGVMSWSYTILGQLAQRLGESESAETYFKHGLTNNSNDYYLLASYADLLISNHRYLETLELLKQYSYVDSLLMRLAIAEIRTNKTGISTYQNLLRQRITDQINTNRSGHLRQLALFQLHIDNNPKQAMVTAQKNWHSQKQIEDGLVLVESAISANRKDIARPILDWLNDLAGSDKRVTTIQSMYDI